MYGICTYIYHKFRPDVGKYTIHGSYGVSFQTMARYVRLVIYPSWFFHRNEFEKKIPRKKMDGTRKPFKRLTSIRDAVISRGFQGFQLGFMVESGFQKENSPTPKITHSKVHWGANQFLTKKTQKYKSQVLRNDRGILGWGGWLEEVIAIIFLGTEGTLVCTNPQRNWLFIVENCHINSSWLLVTRAD